MAVPNVKPEENVDPEEAPAEGAPADEAPGFENRAARRARGKQGAQQQQQQSHGSTQRLDGRSVSGPRQYGNRRSG